MSTLSRKEIEEIVRALLVKYQAEYALLFGSYARGEETSSSDIDLVVFGGEKFLPKNIFAFGEELREKTNLEADVFEITEINKNTDFYNAVMREGVRIA
ncbi:MAG: nucleotidyltransferase domain-containing protein [Lachnospiraceae bacterium]|nr:nucleotidyltransferase domain-containing protein [Lachnospiraceae bacterium]